MQIFTPVLIEPGIQEVIFNIKSKVKAKLLLNNFNRRCNVHALGNVSLQIIHLINELADIC